MVIHDTSSAACFAEGVKQILKRQPRGAQTKLAQTLGVSKQYMNDIVSQRAATPDELKDRIAKELGLSLIELLYIGETYITTGKYFPYMRGAVQLPAQSFERAAYIYKKAAEESKIGVTFMYTADAMKPCQYPGVQEFVDGTMDDADLYDEAMRFFQKLLEYYLK